MAFELNGIIIEIFPAQTFNKGFRKREFVIESGDKYPQKIVFGLVQDKCDMIDSYGIGDTVSVAFDVKKARDSRSKFGDKSGANRARRLETSSDATTLERRVNARRFSPYILRSVKLKRDFPTFQLWAVSAVTERPSNVSSRVLPKERY
jgi:hypothetical protein